MTPTAYGKLSLIAWVPAWKKWPLEYCAVYGCKNERCEEERDGIWYFRRWCNLHSHIRNQECATNPIEHRVVPLPWVML